MPTEFDMMQPGTLNVLETSFLGGLNLAQNQGFGGTALRLYNDVVQRGRTDPITEKDFGKDELKAYKALVLHKVMKTGDVEGKIDYPDYESFRSSRPKTDIPDSNVLGGFRYSYDPSKGSVSIADRYGFNTNRGGTSGLDDYMASELLGAFANPRGLAAHIGRKVAPKDDQHPGLPVQINIE